MHSSLALSCLGPSQLSLTQMEIRKPGKEPVVTQTRE